MKQLNHATKFCIVSIFENSKINCDLFYFYFQFATRNFVSDLFLIRACLLYDNKSIFSFHLFQSRSFVISREYLKFTDSRNACIKIALSTIYTHCIGALVVLFFFLLFSSFFNMFHECNDKSCSTGATFYPICGSWKIFIDNDAMQNVRSLVCMYAYKHVHRYIYILFFRTYILSIIIKNMTRVVSTNRCDRWIYIFLSVHLRRRKYVVIYYAARISRYMAFV